MSGVIRYSARLDDDGCHDIGVAVEPDSDGEYVTYEDYKVMETRLSSMAKNFEDFRSVSDEMLLERDATIKEYACRLDSALARLEWSTQQLDIEQAAAKAATDRLDKLSGQSRDEFGTCELCGHSKPGHYDECGLFGLVEIHDSFEEATGWNPKDIAPGTLNDMVEVIPKPREPDAGTFTATLTGSSGPEGTTLTYHMGKIKPNKSE